MTTARYYTAQQVMDQAAIELGLDAPGATVYSSTDKNIILLRNLLNAAGQELALMYPWPALVKEHTITVANPGDSGTYTLPTDFNGAVPQTGWDRTNDYQINLVSPQVWQYIKTGAFTTGTALVNARFDQDSFRVETVPDNGVVLAFEYQSRYWVSVTGSTTLSKAAPTVSTDVIFFEPVMIVALLRLRYKEARGDDTTAALVSFERRYDLAVSSVTHASILNADGRTRGFRYLDVFNVPDTGYGS